MFRSYQITPRLSIIVKVIVHGTIFSATQRCNVETMLSLLETMSQRCCNAVLRYKSSLRIVSCNITFSGTANPQKNEIQPPFLKKKQQQQQLIFAMNLPGTPPPSGFNPPPPHPPPPANIAQSL